MPHECCLYVIRFTTSYWFYPITFRASSIRQLRSLNLTGWGALGSSHWWLFDVEHEAYFCWTSETVVEPDNLLSNQNVCGQTRQNTIIECYNITHWSRDQMAAIAQTTFSAYFLVWKLLHFDSKYNEICLKISIHASLGINDKHTVNWEC